MSTPPVAQAFAVARAEIEALEASRMRLEPGRYVITETIVIGNGRNWIGELLDKHPPPPVLPDVPLHKRGFGVLDDRNE